MPFVGANALFVSFANFSTLPDMMTRLLSLANFSIHECRAMPTLRHAHLPVSRQKEAAVAKQLHPPLTSSASSTCILMRPNEMIGSRSEGKKTNAAYFGNRGPRNGAITNEVDIATAACAAKFKRRSFTREAGTERYF